MILSMKTRAVHIHFLENKKTNKVFYLQKFATNKRQPSNAKLPWFLTNLESYYAKEMEAWELARLQKDDSGDSNENGDDLPIEIRHLEDNADMLLIPPLFPAVIAGMTVIMFGEEQMSKSKSLNDITKLMPVQKRRMKDHGRSNTVMIQLCRVWKKH